MTTSPGTLRKRNLTAALRSLKLIRDAVTVHLDTLEGGGIPESTFTVHAAKYAETLAVLHALEALEAPGGGNGLEGWLATVEVSRDDLDILVGVLRQSDMAIAIEQADKGSPLGNILAALEKPAPED